jgi:hypothetical protein
MIKNILNLIGKLFLMKINFLIKVDGIEIYFLLYFDSLDGHLYISVCVCIENLLKQLRILLYSLKRALFFFFLEFVFCRL